MSNEEAVHNISISMDQAKIYIANKESLDKLIANPDFDRIITKGYFENEASRLVLTKADPGMESADKQAAIIKSIDGIGSLRTYLRAIMQIGEMAQKDLKSSEEELELAENEDI